MVSVEAVLVSWGADAVGCAVVGAAVELEQPAIDTTKMSSVTSAIILFIMLFFLLF
jgi:hypothetical protein